MKQSDNNIQQLHGTDDDTTPVRRAVAVNLRDARLSRGWSLRELASETNLSTALLSQIERSVANPTVIVLAKIAAALDLTFAELTRPIDVETEIVRAKESDGTLPEARSLFAMMDRRRFDISEGHLPPHQSGVFSDHGQHSIEYTYVVSGSVILTLGSEVFELHQHDSIRFSSAHQHAYSTGELAAVLLTVVSYGQ